MIIIDHQHHDHSPLTSGSISGPDIRSPQKSWSDDRGGRQGGREHCLPSGKVQLIPLLGFFHISHFGFVMKQIQRSKRAKQAAKETQTLFDFR